MADAGSPVAARVATFAAAKKPASKKGFLLRPWVRAIHRDVGYVAVGLTIVYAVSGLAVNHLTAWSDGDASFSNYTAEHELGPIALMGKSEEEADRAAADAVTKKLGITQAPREIFRTGEGQLDVLFDKRTLHVDARTGHVVDEGQRPRFFLRVANWLHLNRGKKAWSYAADAYAGALLFLAFSGMFMIPGKKGFLGRGAALVAVGVAIPVLYVTLSGGP